MSLNPKARRKDVIVHELEGEVLIYDLNTNEAFSLNQTSAKVWQKCDGQKSPEKIAEEINIPAEMVMFAINDLQSKNLLEANHLPKNEWISRRAIIKLGIAFGVGVPTITSLIAPVASMAASGLACGNGVVGGGESCDDGNTISGDGCSSTCQTESGYVCNGQPSTCSPVCGDGLRRGGEECDDGNSASGDGCSSICLTESGFVCSGEPSVCTPN